MIDLREIDPTEESFFKLENCTLFGIPLNWMNIFHYYNLSKSWHRDEFIIGFEFDFSDQEQFYKKDQEESGNVDWPAIDKFIEDKVIPFFDEITRYETLEWYYEAGEFEEMWPWSLPYVCYLEIRAWVASNDV